MPKDDYPYPYPKPTNEGNTYLLVALPVTIVILPMTLSWVLLGVLLHHPHIGWGPWAVTLFDWSATHVWNSKVKLPANWHIEVATLTLIFAIVAGITWFKSWLALARKAAEREGLPFNRKDN